MDFIILSIIVASEVHSLWTRWEYNQACKSTLTQISRTMFPAQLSSARAYRILQIVARSSFTATTMSSTEAEQQQPAVNLLNWTTQHAASLLQLHFVTVGRQPKCWWPSLWRETADWIGIIESLVTSPLLFRASDQALHASSAHCRV